MQNLLKLKRLHNCEETNRFLTRNLTVSDNARTLENRVPGSEEVWLGSYFPYILLVFGQIQNFLFHHNLRQLRDFLFSLNIHFDWTNSAWFVFYMNLLLSKMYLIDFPFFLFFFSFSVKSYQCNIIIHQLNSLQLSINI